MFYPPSKTTVETIRRYGELAALGCDPGVAARAWSDSRALLGLPAAAVELYGYQAASPIRHVLPAGSGASTIEFSHTFERGTEARVVRTTLAVATGAVIAKAREWSCITVLTSFLGRDNHEGVLPVGQDERRDHQAVR